MLVVPSDVVVERIDDNQSGRHDLRSSEESSQGVCEEQPSEALTLTTLVERELADEYRWDLLRSTAADVSRNLTARDLVA